MTVIYLFSKNRKVLSFFAKLKKSRTFSLIIYNPVNYRKILSTETDNIFTYIDLSGFSDIQKSKLITFITRQKKFDFGIIDPENWVKDPASLFFKGASDYIPKSAITGTISVKRVKEAVSFYTLEEAGSSSFPQDNTDGIFSGSNWDTIKTGQSYTFIFMFIEIDILEEWIANSGKTHLESIMDYFYSHLNAVIKPLNGKIWIKTTYGALVLFPYAGSATPVIIESFKLILNKLIISAEIYPFKTILSYRIALDLGTTKYLARGNTGNIVSDSVNYIFHLGNQYIKKGNFYLTNRIHEDIPPGLMEYFILEGDFQGKTIHRMKLPVFSDE